jgi:hypothetical protein
MGGTVQKKSACAKQFLLTQHQQNFRAARALAQAQSRSQLASARERNRIEKIFWIRFLELLKAQENARGMANVHRQQIVRCVNRNNWIHHGEHGEHREIHFSSPCSPCSPW